MIPISIILRIIVNDEFMNYKMNSYMVNNYFKRINWFRKILYVLLRPNLLDYFQDPLIPILYYEYISSLSTVNESGHIPVFLNLNIGLSYIQYTLFRKVHFAFNIQYTRTTK